MKTLLAIQLLFWASTTYASSIAGVASVIDGDTLKIRNQRIRLHGIDAPESRQLCTKKSDGKNWRCGQLAAFALSDFKSGSGVFGRQTSPSPGNGASKSVSDDLYFCVYILAVTLLLQ